MRKLLILFIVICLSGCYSDKVVVSSGKSKTYAFFKEFDVNKYYVSFFDRNATSSDDTKIIMARDSDKYYYEVDGANKQVIIQKDGVKYTVMDNGYFVSDDVYDYSYGILPDPSKLVKKKYKTGRQKLFGVIYVFEEFTFDKDVSTYYFKGDKLCFIRYSSPLQEILLKFDKFGKVKSKLFEIDDDLVLLSY